LNTIHHTNGNDMRSDLDIPILFLRTTPLPQSLGFPPRFQDAVVLIEAVDDSGALCVHWLAGIDISSALRPVGPISDAPHLPCSNPLQGQEARKVATRRLR
jgi:hypothetical protein